MGRRSPCLACAYGFIEEGLVTQSLFNPNYLGLRLLDFGFIPALGTALPWLIYVISIHVVWSICVPIGLAESLFPAKRDQPWLGPIGIGVFSLLLAGRLRVVAIFTYKQRPFMASGAQLTTTGLIVAALIVAALKWPAAKVGAAPAPHAVVLFLAALIFGSALMVLQQIAAVPVALESDRDVSLPSFCCRPLSLGSWRCSRAERCGMIVSASL